MKKKDVVKKSVNKSKTLEQEFQDIDRKMAKNNRRKSLEKMAEKAMQVDKMTKHSVGSSKTNNKLSESELLVLLKPMIRKAQKEGYITFTELNDFLPKDLDEASIDCVLAIFEDRGLNVKTEKDTDYTESASDDKLDNDTENYTEDENGNTIIKSNNNEDDVFISDPMGIYISKMGKNALLSREQEVEIAKNIELGNQNILRNLCKTTIAMNAFVDMYEDYVNEKILLREIVDMEALYAKDTANETFMEVEDTNLERQQGEKNKLSYSNMLQSKITSFRERMNGDFESLNDDELDDCSDGFELGNDKQVSFAAMEKVLKPKVLDSLRKISDLMVHALAHTIGLGKISKSMVQLRWQKTAHPIG